jgi:hypothetical protein
MRATAGASSDGHFGCTWLNHEKLAEFEPFAGVKS